MAGMFFCSLREAAQRLKKTEEELKQIVKQEKLQDYRDESKILFKIDEVEALAKRKDIMMPSKAPAARPNHT